MLVSEIVYFDKRRSKVLTDGDFAFVLYNGEVNKLRLKEGEELSDEMINQKIIPLLTKRARERTVYLLRDSDKTEMQLRRKLTMGGYPGTVQDKVLDWAKEKHFVDDMRYASFYVECHGKGKSLKKLKYDMLLKGISKEIIENILSDTVIDEEEQIRNELIKKRYNPDEKDPKIRRKMTAYLARKGYSWADISHVLKDMPTDE